MILHFLFNSKTVTLVLPYLKQVNREVSKTMWMQGKNIKIYKSEMWQKVTPSARLCLTYLTYEKAH